MQTVVCSRTLRPADHPGVTIAADAATAVGELKSRPGKDIWLFGGGALFRCLLDAGLVDVIELSIMPVLLSRGVPLLPAGGRSPQLKLIRSAITPAGIATLVYSVVHDPR
jgi:dihydrofolate reductase